MNPTTQLQVANYLQVSPNQIKRIEEWENCYFVVVQGLGGRFVSKKVVKTAAVLKVPTAYEIELSKLCRKVRRSNHTLAGRRQRAMFC